MQNASLNIAQTLGAGLAGRGKAPAGLGDILSAGNNDAFRSMLLGGLAKSGAANAVKAENPAPVASIEIISVPADLLARLQALRSGELDESLPPELAAVFAPHLNADGTLNETAGAMIDALGALSEGDTAALNELMAQNKDLAALVAQFTEALKAMNLRMSQAAAGDIVHLFDDLATKVLGSDAHVRSVQVSGNGLVLSTDKGTITVDAADMDLEQFNAFKKLAFADLAPFLTEPRTVRIDPHTLMKSVQGPSFLDDPDAPKVVFIRIGRNVGALPAGMVVDARNAAAAAALQAQAQGDVSESQTPFFLDPALIARAGAAVPQQPSAQAPGDTLALPAGASTAVATGAAPAQAKPNVFGRAELFAALLGVSPADDTAPQAQAATPVLAAADAAVQRAQNTSALATALQNATAGGMPAQGGLHAHLAPVLKGLDNALLTTDSEGADLLGAGFDAAFPVRADASSATAAASTLLQSRGAGAGHPAVHLVSVALARSAEGAAMGMDRQFTIQLDPENLGKVKVTLEFGENNTVRAKLVAERPETVALLQKDAAALERSLHNSGFDVKPDSLAFSLGGEGSFQGSMSHNGNSYQNGGNQPSDEDGTDLATIETVMPVFVDPVTGMTHVNIVV